MYNKLIYNGGIDGSSDDDDDLCITLTGCEKSAVRYCSPVFIRSDPSGWVIFLLQVARLANHVCYPFMNYLLNSGLQCSLLEL